MEWKIPDLNLRIRIERKGIFIFLVLEYNLGHRVFKRFEMKD